MPAAGNTQARLNQTVNALVGQRLTQVTYYGLRQEPDDPPDWDHGDWHHPVMGVGLDTGGSPYSLVWDNSFGEYGAELNNTTMDVHILGIGEPQGPPVWEVTNHPRWAVLLADPVQEATIVWAAPGWPPQEHPQFPVAIRLGFPAGNAWLIAAMPQWPELDRFFWPADEIVVGFTDQFAAKLKLPQPSNL